MKAAATKKKTPAKGYDKFRPEELAKIHIGKADLKLNDDTYRDILREAGKVESAAALDWRGRAAVLARYKELGWKPRHAGKKTSKPNPPSRPLADDPQSKMMRGLWIELHQLGAVRDPSEAALTRFAKRHTRVDDLSWKSGKKASKVIEALKDWRRRARLAHWNKWFASRYPGEKLPVQLEVALETQVMQLTLSDEVPEAIRQECGEAVYALLWEYQQNQKEE
jgi:phage gp16-like protein